MPFDVVNGGGPVRSPNGFWYNGAYAFTDDNDQGYRAGIDRDLPDILADFVFQKVVVARRVNWDGLVRMENSENGDAAPETSPGSKTGQRSVRFLSFGVRRIAFPEEAIRESLTYDFELQALRQLAFNNWQDGVGYLESPRLRADAEYVADRQQREDWRLTDDHLRLQRPTIDTDGSRRWKSFAEEWEAFETHYVGLAQQTDRPRWLNELKTLFQTAWGQNFRTVGVPQFYQQAGRDWRNPTVSNEASTHGVPRFHRGLVRMHMKRLSSSVATTVLMLAWAQAAEAQTTATQAGEVVVTGSRQARSLDDVVTQVQDARDESIVSQAFFSHQSPGENAAQMINLIPGISFVTEDPTGLSAGDLRIHVQTEVCAASS